MSGQIYAKFFVCAIAVIGAALAAPLDEQDPLQMTVDEVMEMFGIDPELDKITREKTKMWNKDDSLVNADELGHYFQGDILTLPSEENGVVNEDRKWPNGEIPYTFWNNDFDEEAMSDIQMAMEEYSLLTGGCVRFRPKTDSDGKDFVFITSQFAGCFALIGKRPNVPNIINYEFPTCTSRYGTIQHEMFHTLGFYHEHTRTDRDEYVIVKWENIEKGRLRASNFIKLPETVIDPQGEEYDYGSVMHYSRTAFSYDGIHQTLIPINPPTAQIGQRIHLSKSDIRKLNSLYECGGNTETTTAATTTAAATGGGGDTTTDGGGQIHAAGAAAAIALALLVTFG